MEQNGDGNKVHSVQVIPAVSKVVPRSVVLCALTDFCYVCFAFSAFSQEEKCRHRGVFGGMVLFISMCTGLCLSDVKVEGTCM